MDPYYEQRLRDEVIYLHSLWRQGPPRTNTNSNQTSRPLQPSSSTQFKKEWKTARGKRGRKGKKNFSDIEWPVNPPAETPPATSSGWPELKLKPNPPANHLRSAEEQARFSGNQAQQKALKCAQEFFSRNADSDGDESDEGDVMEEDVCEEECTFFLNLFMEDRELKGYYEKNYRGGGEFYCLVCGGAGEKFGKRFKDCVALVQHSVTIAKTKKRRAHRAYGQVICKVLAWDIDRLPSIISTLKSRESQGNVGDGDKDLTVLTSNVGSINVDSGEAVLGMDSNTCEVLHDQSLDLPNAMENDLMVFENSLLVAGAIRSMEDPDKVFVNVAEGSAEGAVNSLCRNISSRMVLEAVETKLSDNYNNVALDGRKTNYFQNS